MNSVNDDLLKLVSKYNVPGPRYTSYPTAVQFSENFDKDQLNENVAMLASEAAPVSLYIHIPFCHSLCWYCGCTKVITKNPASADRYLDYLEKEMELVSAGLHPDIQVKQIHFGGGTPTFLSPIQLRRLGASIHHYFNLHNDVEFSVEIDPRRVSEEHISTLQEIGCNRASIGVQDTNVDVQKAIHRIQPFNQTEKVTRFLRKYGMNSINMDLIYGLPKQTLQTFKKTIEDAVSLNPDRFAIYSYAHIPSVMPSQKLLNEDDLPETNEKLRFLVYAIETLPKYGYTFIGMDHFAKDNDELSLALRNGTLQRNFQGYSTHADLNMIGLGMSAISQNNRFYTQNEKDLQDYYDALDRNRLPVRKLLKLTDDDQLRKQVIMQIMCKGELHYDLIQTSFKNTFSTEIEHLKRFEEDGLLTNHESGFKITSKGRLFIRNIAMVFDDYLKEKQHQTSYSKTV